MSLAVVCNKWLQHVLKPKHQTRSYKEGQDTMALRICNSHSDPEPLMSLPPFPPPHRASSDVKGFQPWKPWKHHCCCDLIISGATDASPRSADSKTMWDSLAVEFMGLIVRELPSIPEGLGSFQLTCKAWKSAASAFVLRY